MVTRETLALVIRKSQQQGIYEAELRVDLGLSKHGLYNKIYLKMGRQTLNTFRSVGFVEFYLRFCPEIVYL